MITKDIHSTTLNNKTKAELDLIQSSIENVKQELEKNQTRLYRETDKVLTENFIKLKAEFQNEIVETQKKN